MTIRILTAGAVIVMICGACSSETPVSTADVPAATRSAPAAATTQAASLPQPIPGYDWAMRTNDEHRSRSAILAYEQDNTDDQPLNFTCEEGGNRVFAGITGGRPDLSAITVNAGGLTRTLNGRTEVDEMPNFTAQEIPADDPLFLAVVQDGGLRLTVAGRTSDMAAASEDGRAAIREFQAFCAG